MAARTTEVEARAADVGFGVLKGKFQDIQRTLWLVVLNDRLKEGRGEFPAKTNLSERPTDTSDLRSVGVVRAQDLKCVAL
jgi:hypothetical protein